MTYWFPAKKYGWGWTWPAAWQGWVVLAVYVVLSIGGIFVLDAGQHPLRFIGFLAFLSALLIAICWLKGEPPKWRWGERS
jgi:hypothetical protein